MPPRIADAADRAHIEERPVIVYDLVLLVIDVEPAFAEIDLVVEERLLSIPVATILLFA